jgi:hypothetical protein
MKNSEGLLELAEEQQITDFDYFFNLFIDQAELCALDNFNETQEPELYEDQFDSSIKMAITEYTLNQLYEKGLVEPVLMDSSMDLGYQLTTSGKSISNAISKS